MQYAFIKKNENAKSVTDNFAYWAKPSKQIAVPSKISDINFNNPNNMSGLKKQKIKHDFIKKLPITLKDNETFHNFLSKLQVINNNASILKVVEPYNLTFVKNNFPMTLTNIYKEEYATLTRKDLVDIGNKLDFTLTEENCSIIESITRTQSESKDWFLYRIGRITASKAKSVCCVKSFESNKSLIKSICYTFNNDFKNIATEWGKKHESSGKKLYLNKLKNEHINFSLSTSGLVINPNCPYIGASPDGIINCDCCGKGCLEIKCPYSISNDEVFD